MCVWWWLSKKIIGINIDKIQSTSTLLYFPIVDSEGYSGNTPCTPSYSLCHMIHLYKIWYLFYMPIPDHFTLIIKYSTPSQGKWSMFYTLPWQFECKINPSLPLGKFNILGRNFCLWCFFFFYLSPLLLPLHFQ